MTTAPLAVRPTTNPLSDAGLTYSPALSSTVRVLIVAVVTLVTCMEFVTSYAVGVALPDMQGDLSASFDEGTWILTMYTTTWLLGLVLSNWLSARIGYRRYLIAAVTLFMCSSIGCGMSRTLTEMLIFRAVMGFAGGTFLVRGQTAINLSYLGMDRFKALLVYGTGVVTVARVAGPAVGGYLTEWYSWRAIFYLNVPLALVALTILVVALPDVKARLGAAQRRLDLVGLILLVGWIAPLQIVLSRGQRDDWFADPSIISLSIVAAACFPLFVWWELRSDNPAPIISLRTYLNRSFLIGSAYVIVLGMMLYGQLYVVPQFLRNVLHHSAWGTGKLQTFNAVAFAVGLTVGALLIKRLGFRACLAVGAAAFTAGMWCWAVRLTPQISDREMLLPLALTGFGAGWQIGPLSILINRDTRPSLMGEGMELYLCQRQLGGSWGIALLAILVDRHESFWSSRLGEHLSEYEISGHVTGSALAQGMAALHAAGVSPGDADAASLVLLHGRLLVQTVVNSFRDTFVYQAGLGVVALALIVLLGRGRTAVDVWRWMTGWSR
jgi:DHA2 family multidrug resistance protein